MESKNFLIIGTPANLRNLDLKVTLGNDLHRSITADRWRRNALEIRGDLRLSVHDERTAASTFFLQLFSSSMSGLSLSRASPSSISAHRSSQSGLSQNTDSEEILCNIPLSSENSKIPERSTKDLILLSKAIIRNVAGKPMTRDLQALQLPKVVVAEQPPYHGPQAVYIFFAFATLKPKKKEVGAIQGKQEVLDDQQLPGQPDAFPATFSRHQRCNDAIVPNGYWGP
ncbi:hypothetical protein Ahy_Scaffold1g107328 isoform H [Arachis hypogaea]|uniref:Uncharacterized protein n=1 Tax=Arachis hypogaea TaxID=3818 RepID=A0A444WVB8_ARAHY|nr:hypothetical protein Ahy_Scaffold1g107328 isoform H [Arachis hypogaea]